MSIDDILERVPGRMLAWIAIAFNYAEIAVEKAKAVAAKFTKAYTIIARPHYYVFFEGSPNSPYFYYDVNYWASGSASAELIYWADNKTFVPWIPGGTAAIEELLTKKHADPLPILSLEIVDPMTERVVYDLTDFIEEMKVVSVNGFPGPSVPHVVAAWSISSGVVPNFNKYMLRYVDSDGVVYPAGAHFEEEVGETEVDATATTEDSESKESTDAETEEKPVLTDLSGAPLTDLSGSSAAPV